MPNVSNTSDAKAPLPQASSSFKILMPQSMNVASTKWAKLPSWTAASTVLGVLASIPSSAVINFAEIFESGTDKEVLNRTLGFEVTMAIIVIFSDVFGAVSQRSTSDNYQRLKRLCETFHPEGFGYTPSPLKVKFAELTYGEPSECNELFHSFAKEARSNEKSILLNSTPEILFKKLTPASYVVVQSLFVILMFIGCGLMASLFSPRIQNNEKTSSSWDFVGNILLLLGHAGIMWTLFSKSKQSSALSKLEVSLQAKVEHLQLNHRKELLVTELKLDNEEQWKSPRSDVEQLKKDICELEAIRNNNKNVGNVITPNSSNSPSP